MDHGGRRCTFDPGPPGNPEGPAGPEGPWEEPDKQVQSQPIGESPWGFKQLGSSKFKNVYRKTDMVVL